MSNMKEQKFLEILLKTGYPRQGHQADEFDWLFDVGSEFMEWFCEYIDSCNILELEVFKCEDLGEDDLDKALKEAGVDDRYLKITEADNKMLREEVAEVNSQIETYHQITKELRIECEDLSNILCQLKEEEKSASSRLSEAMHECCELGEQLEKEHEAIALKLCSVSSILSGIKNNASEMQLVAQLSLDGYKGQLDLYNELLQTYINLQFPDLNSPGEDELIPSVLKGRNDAALVEFKEEVKRLQCSIAVVSLGVILERAENAALDSVLEYVKDLKSETVWKEEDIQSLEVALQQGQQLFEDMVQQVKKACKETAELEILQRIISPECRYKKIRQKYWIDKLKWLSECTERQLSLGSTLKLMINSERYFMSYVMSIATAFQKYLSEEYENRMIRMNAMESAQQSFLTNKNMLSSHLSKLLGHDNDLKAAIARHNQDIAASEDNVFTEALNKKKNIIMINDMCVRDLEKFVFSGPTKKLVHFDPNCRVYLNTKLKIQEFEEILEGYRRQKEKKDVEMTLYPLRRKRRLLWIYYLTNPEEFLNTINSGSNFTVESRMFVESPPVHSTNSVFCTSTPLRMVEEAYSNKSPQPYLCSPFTSQR